MADGSTAGSCLATARPLAKEHTVHLETLVVCKKGIGGITGLNMQLRATSRKSLLFPSLTPRAQQHLPHSGHQISVHSSSQSKDMTTHLAEPVGSWVKCTQYKMNHESIFLPFPSFYSSLHTVGFRVNPRRVRQEWARVVSRVAF